jgi:hypothetical protein
MTDRETLVSGRRAFELAPMSGLIRALTVFLLALPAVLALAGVAAGQPLPLLAVAALMVLTYGAVWVWWRPSAFEVSDTAFDIVFPGRRKSIPRRAIVAVRPFSVRSVRSELGFPLRIGVGGLWGGFGWLWTTRRGLVEFYVSRTDGLVFIERRGAYPLLITPADSEALLRALQD